ncbi:hypothetical protein LMG3431_02565 [Achromobacter pestifer]|uniref:Uncharacterized protein n=1 Tax=Achromobacter pestifer TaxID=1353889 RepID=A0A6S6ZGV3_9BURK|nr:hypothetical protein LMG3431_02565 [Achromobacter pestifer]
MVVTQGYSELSIKGYIYRIALHAAHGGLLGANATQVLFCGRDQGCGAAVQRFGKPQYQGKVRHVCVEFARVLLRPSLSSSLRWASHRR